MLVMILFPFKVNAGEVISSELKGNTSVTVGDNIELTFDISVSELSENNLGIYVITYELDYDQNVFSVNSVTASGWKNAIVKENGKSYVVSIFTGENGSNKCSNNKLYCGKYTAKLSFYTKDTNKSVSTIKIGKVSVSLLDIGITEINEDELIEINGIGNSKAISINRPTNNSSVQNTQTSNTTNDESKNNEEKKEDEENKQLGSENERSSNNYLEYIKIKGYKIDFDKYNNTYTLTVPKETNELDITVEAEDENALYSIIGADDLKGSNDIVLIEVLAENGNKNVYIINVKRDQGISIPDNYLFIALAIGGGILMGILVMVIVSLISNRKIDQGFKNM